MYGIGDRPAEDLTARARIVDAALQQFARRGVAGATMRSIAETAGVSVGLVQHHFGTKDGLREACDERVLALARAKVVADAPGGRLTDPDVLDSLFDAAMPVMPYVGRVALEPDERAASLFDEMASLTAQWLSGRWPDRFVAGSDRTRGATAVMVAMSMSTAVFHHQLARVMGLGPDEPTPSPRVGLAALDVYQTMGEYLTSPDGARLRQAVEDHYERQTTRHEHD